MRIDYYYRCEEQVPFANCDVQRLYNSWRKYVYYIDYL